MFIAVVESKSIHRGALALGVSQPAVSATIRELELTYGAPLLVRSSRGVEVTELGALFLQRGRALLADMERLSAEMARLHSAKAGKISIAVSAVVTSGVLSGVLKKFRAEMPDVHVRIAEIAELSELLNGLREGEFDFAAVQTPYWFLPLPDDIEQLAEVTLPIIVGCREQHPLANATSLADLIDAEWIFPVGSEGATDLAISKGFAQYGLEVPRRPVHCHSRAVALDLFETMDFIGLFTRNFADINFKRYGLVQIRIKEKIPGLQAGIFQRKSAVQTAPSAYLMDCFLNILRSMESAGQARS
jgi:DNA-binding transcriptional LysR family regulator